ncbi:hypothetical protein PP175_21595 [Aneurinibacillus sp. Ricciae_BoGa-3]|uniref:hypothetical protein n=1 Tax=Aneurinibacillus sp. Ricciae_BoGa-3 TaxID=3022697 RepID=UPI002341DE77|nr:hypothetical protein [Aneurinibacillus sp. Ricciae_BoGa-3]WCK53886.1 hypothetical protein PP175_21595 [Aneurinibacillus sp. Ricciae_BoGa-3]
MDTDKAIDTILKVAKILGPVFAVMFLMYGGLGVFIYFMYTFNVSNHIANSFPSQFIIYFFFIVAIIAAFCITIIALLQSLSFDNKATETETPANRSA